MDPKTYADASLGMYERQVAEIHAAYQARLLVSNAMDPDDLLLNTVRLFEQIPGCSSTISADLPKFWWTSPNTNKVQNSIVWLLGSAHGNVFLACGGDGTLLECIRGTSETMSSKR